MLAGERIILWFQPASPLILDSALADFIHLRVHSSYSLSEGAIHLKQLTKLCTAHKMPAMAVTDTGKEAITHYRAIEAFEGATLLECKLATGRTHQIRVHMASIGFPIAGDPVYRSALRARLPRAGERNVPVPEAIKAFPRQALHARRLAFIHPVSGERVGFDAPLPADFAALLATLREAM